MSTKENIIEHLREVYDPEISINVYDLGLIYEIDLKDQHCDITMTLTSPMCPAVDEILADVHEAVTREVESCDITITFDPPFGPDKMSEEARLLLGFE